MATRRTAGPARAGLQQVIDGFGSKRLRVGFMPEAQYEDGTPIAYVAAIHEYGAPGQGIPPRPFMRPTQAREGAQWQTDFAGAARAVARGAITPDAALGAMGGVVAGQISQSIANVQSPPLKPGTIRSKQGAYVDGAKGGVGNLTKPLVRTGQLIAAPTWVVDSKGDET